jgi:CheY-like chemotaxis protein
MSGSVQSPGRQIAALQTNGQEELPQRKLVLLVDDRYFERLAIRAGIETFTTFRVSDAANGAEGVKKARELKPDLVLLDLAMPIMNGLAAAHILRTHMPNIQVVVLTIHAEVVPPPRQEVLGIKAVLDKTDGLSPLIECLKRFLMDPLKQSD